MHDKQMDNLWDQLALIRDRSSTGYRAGADIVPILKGSVIPMFEKFVEWVGKLCQVVRRPLSNLAKIILIALGF